MGRSNRVHCRGSQYGRGTTLSETAKIKIKVNGHAYDVEPAEALRLYLSLKDMIEVFKDQKPAPADFFGMDNPDLPETY